MYSIFSTTVRLGDYNIDTDPDCVESVGNIIECAPSPLILNVEEKIVHEDYNPYDLNQYHDIALLRLAEEVKYTGIVHSFIFYSTLDLEFITSVTQTVNVEILFENL